MTKEFQNHRPESIISSPLHPTYLELDARESNAPNEQNEGASHHHSSHPPKKKPPSQPLNRPFPISTCRLTTGNSVPHVMHNPSLSPLYQLPNFYPTISQISDKTGWWRYTKSQRAQIPKKKKKRRGEKTVERFL
jgi:hypothetical protein